MNNDAIKETFNGLAEKAQQIKFFWQGVLLGLFYGIVGNMFVSHYYGVFVAFVAGKFDFLFWCNLLFLFSISCVLFFVSWKMWHKMNDFFNAVHIMKILQEMDERLDKK